jgi:hypothetical protein
MGLPTSVGNSDSWSAIGQLCADTADLAITGAGRLECRPLLATDQPLEQQTCSIPPEVWEERVGYVVVQIDQAEQKAYLLGFVKTAAIEDLPLTQLQPPEELLTHLDQLLHPVSARQLATQAAQTVLTNLSRWLQNHFETGWQTVEALLTPSELQLAYSFRGASAETNAAIRRAKLIQLVNQPLILPFVLVVEILPEVGQETGICLQVHPSQTQYLPANLRLAVLDETGTIFLEAIAREADNYLQLQLSGRSGESFRVELRLADSSVIENFVI